MTAIDQKCEGCHSGHIFHQPDVVRTASCSACHREHDGPGAIAPPQDANCLECHGDEGVMQASFELSTRLPAAAFDYRPSQGRILFKAPRPDRGYTQIVHSFAGDHAEFQAVRDAQLKDPDTLKFNHQLHLTSINVALPNGKKLTCENCHKPDAAGMFHLKITYEENCKLCHRLQFDPEAPGLVLPHGDAEHVRAFLRSLPDQYAAYATSMSNILGGRKIEDFVQKQIERLKRNYESGEELEKRVFLSNGRISPVSQIGRMDPVGAAQFPGCAYCHEVAPDTLGVTKPLIPDRWLIRGRFDHGKHFKVACATCHDAERSRQTSDILLPSKNICADCHSAKGGVAHNCATCHSYHVPQKETITAR